MRRSGRAALLEHLASLNCSFQLCCLLQYIVLWAGLNLNQPADGFNVHACEDVKIIIIKKKKSANETFMKPSVESKYKRIYFTKP